MTDISIKDFVQALCKELLPSAQSTFQSGNASLLPPMQLLHYGHVKGWLEDQDEVNCDNPLDKRTAARILHQFLKIELHRPDAPDITPAQALQDLYTCRVCANHIAQVYVQGLMEAEETELQDQIVLIFNNLKPVSKEEALLIIQKAETNNKA